MNIRDILNMPAGREVDALIAVKVFGLSLEHLPVLYEEGNTEDGSKYYSTDIAAAFDVVSEMSSKNYWFGCQLLSSISEAWFSFEGMIVSKERASTHDLPLAICRAALFAVMSNKNA